MRQTEKYQLNLIDPGDKFLPDPINENTEKTEAAINACARIATGTYVGTGTYGKDNPCTLTFGFTPKFVMVYESDMGWLTGYHFDLEGETEYFASATLIAAYGATRAYAHRTAPVGDDFTWGENSFSWYTDTYAGHHMNAALQLNQNGKTYYYIAIG